MGVAFTRTVYSVAWKLYIHVLCTGCPMLFQQLLVLLNRLPVQDLQVKRHILERCKQLKLTVVLVLNIEKNSKHTPEADPDIFDNDNR